MIRGRAARADAPESLRDVGVSLDNPIWTSRLAVAADPCAIRPQPLDPLRHARRLAGSTGSILAPVTKTSSMRRACTGHPWRLPMRLSAALLAMLALAVPALVGAADPPGAGSDPKPAASEDSSSASVRGGEPP